MAKQRTNTLPAAIEFDGIEIRIVDRDGRPWITLDDLARALYGIKGGDTSVTPLRAIRRIFSKNEREFRANMTAMLTMETAGGPQQVRIFSSRGVHLMAMLAKTPVAEQFRDWVLDVLEGKIEVAAQRQRGASLTPEQIDRRLQIEAGKVAVHGLDALRRAMGNRAAALAAPAIFKAFGINIDPTSSDTLAQTELFPFGENVGHG